VGVGAAPVAALAGGCAVVRQVRCLAAHDRLNVASVDDALVGEAAAESAIRQWCAVPWAWR
jgi:hypothetical protein